jgi:MFS family permease
LLIDPIAFNTRGSRFQASQILEALKDPKAWGYAFINGGAGMTLSSLGVFLPTFVANFGFSKLDAQLFSAIPYACAFVVLPTLAYISDRVNTKGPFIVGGLTFSAAGYLMLLFANPTSVKIVATCFITCGTYPAVVLTVTWLGINTAGFTKKGATWAMAEIMSQIMSIVASNIYKNPPRYVKGHSVVLAMLVFSNINAIALWLWMGYSNKQRDRILAEYAARGEIHPDAEKSLEEASDLHINFRYVL